MAGIWIDQESSAGSAEFLSGSTAQIMKKRRFCSKIFDF